LLEGDVQMTEMQALAELDKMLEDGYSTNDQKEAITMARKSLEKQITKKPTNLTRNMEHMLVGNCPCCNKFVSELYDKSCKCGQRLNWGYHF
jgi:hypothetical protein